MTAPADPPGAALPFTVLGRETLHAGFCRIERVATERPGRDGAVIRFAYEIESHGHGVGVLVYDPTRRIAVLVRQLRIPAALDGDPAMPLEVAAGLFDPTTETAEAAARREAHEEIGFELGRLVPVARGRAMPGLSSEKLSLFFAEIDLERDRVADGGGLAEEGEEVEVVLLPLADLAALADVGEAFDLKTLTLIQTLRLKRPELFV